MAKKIFILLSIFLIISMVVYGDKNSKYKVEKYGENPSVVFLYEEGVSTLYEVREQIEDYALRMTHTRLPFYVMDGQYFFMYDSMFKDFNYTLTKDIFDDYSSNYQYIITYGIECATKENVTFNDIKLAMDIMTILDTSKKIKTNLSKIDYYVPYYLYKVVYTHMLINTIGNSDLTTLQKDIVDSELEKYITLINKETKEQPWYTKMKLYDEVFGTYMAEYTDIVRELTLEVANNSYGETRPIWIFKNTEANSKFYDLYRYIEKYPDDRIYRTSSIEPDNLTLRELLEKYDYDDYEKFDDGFYKLFQKVK